MMGLDLFKAALSNHLFKVFFEDIDRSHRNEVGFRPKMIFALQFQKHSHFLKHCAYLFFINSALRSVRILTDIFLKEQ